ncbi:hypothetical protein [Anaerovorax odorimutans]|nr:hypothetical protein [Anaerovorax odorimutans]
MNKNLMKFKLCSYRQALKKAIEKNDKNAIKCWKADIKSLKQEIEHTV